MNADAFDARFRELLTERGCELGEPALGGFVRARGFTERSAPAAETKIVHVIPLRRLIGRRTRTFFSRSTTTGTLATHELDRLLAAQDSARQVGVAHAHDFTRVDVEQRLPRRDHSRVVEPVVDDADGCRGVVPEGVDVARVGDVASGPRDARAGELGA